MTLQMMSVVAMMVMGLVAAAVWSAIRARQKRRQEELERHTSTLNNSAGFLKESRSFRYSIFANLWKCWPTRR
jgi:hypothetical protein